MTEEADRAFSGTLREKLLGGREELADRLFGRAQDERGATKDDEEKEDERA